MISKKVWHTEILAPEPIVPNPKMGDIPREKSVPIFFNIYHVVLVLGK